MIFLLSFSPLKPFIAPEPHKLLFGKSTFLFLQLQSSSSFGGEASPYGTWRRRGGAHNGARGFAHLTLFHPVHFPSTTFCTLCRLHFTTKYFANFTLFHPVLLAVNCKMLHSRRSTLLFHEVHLVQVYIVPPSTLLNC